jgi:hypothetical protein
MKERNDNSEDDDEDDMRQGFLKEMRLKLKKKFSSNKISMILSFYLDVGKEWRLKFFKLQGF